MLSCVESVVLADPPPPPSPHPEQKHSYKNRRKIEIRNVQPVETLRTRSC